MSRFTILVLEIRATGVLCDGLGSIANGVLKQVLPVEEGISLFESIFLR